MELGDSTIAMSRPVVFGAMTQVAVGRQHIWHSLSDRYEFERRDTAGTVTGLVRVAVTPRVVDEASKTKYKEILREQYERMKAMIPPQLLESELKKIDQTVFAESFAPIGQIVVDDTDAIWVTNAMFTDTTSTWAIFDADGVLKATVVLPEGQLLSASSSRLILRREDDATGVVRIEVWGLNRGPATAGDTGR